VLHRTDTDTDTALTPRTNFNIQRTMTPLLHRFYPFPWLRTDPLTPHLYTTPYTHPLYTPPAYTLGTPPHVTGSAADLPGVLPKRTLPPCKTGLFSFPMSRCGNAPLNLRTGSMQS